MKQWPALSSTFWGTYHKQGEQLRYKGLKIVITEMRGRKIEKIVVTKEKHAATAD